jgi:hypothetical protein
MIQELKEMLCDVASALALLFVMCLVVGLALLAISNAVVFP